MSKEFVAEPILADCEEKADKPAAEREFTITIKFHKTTVNIVICLLIFCLSFGLGFVFGGLGYTARHQKIDEQIDGIHQHVFVFDTEQKIADHFKAMAARHRPECSFVRQTMARVGRDQPLVTAGPFTIFVNNDTDEFSVHESTSPLPLVELSRVGQTKFLRLHGLLENGRDLPRFGAIITYSAEDTVYTRASVSLSNDDRTLTSFKDSKGTGVFDTKEVWESGVRVHYRLNGLTWEPLDESTPMLPPPPGSSFIP